MACQLVWVSIIGLLGLFHAFKTLDLKSIYVQYTASKRGVVTLFSERSQAVSSRAGNPDLYKSISKNPRIP